MLDLCGEMTLNTYEKEEARSTESFRILVSNGISPFPPTMCFPGVLDKKCLNECGNRFKSALAGYSI